MKRLIDLFIEKTAWVNGITIVIVLIGGFALYGMKRDLHPPFHMNRIEVVANLEGASAEEVERLVTYPIEESLLGFPELEELKSRSQAGSLRITLKFPQSVKDMTQKLELVRNRIQRVSTKLPKEIENFRVYQWSDENIFLANIGIIGLDPLNHDHHKWVSQLAEKLRSVRGTESVDSSLRPLQIFIRFESEKLARNGVTITQIRKAIGSELQPQSIGYNSINGREWLIEFSQGNITPEAVAAIPLFQNSQKMGLKVGDVAKVEYDFERGGNYHFLYNGRPAVELVVFKTPELDSINMFAEVKKILAETVKPEGIQLQVLDDGPYFIQQQLSVLSSNGLGGLLLVLAMLALAMGFKTSLMTALGLPISYLGTFLILRLMGISIDLISMIAMILVVGNLVDDAVIFAERYNALLTEGLDPKEAASKAANELIVPVSGTIATIICAFLPIIVIDSELSVIFFAIPIVVAIALGLSWFETFFILPNHLQHYVRTAPRERSVAFFHFIARYYKRALSHTLKFRYLYGVISIACLGGSLYVATKMPQNFTLSANAPQVEIFVTFKEEHSFEEIKQKLLPLHDTLRAQLDTKEVEYLETNLGWMWRDGKSYRGPRFGTIKLILDKKEIDTKTLREKVLEQTKKIVAEVKIPEIQELDVVGSARGGGDRRENLASIEISGRDEEAFKTVQNELIKAIENKEPVQAHVPPDDQGPIRYQFKADTGLLRAYNLGRDELGTQLEAYTGSVELAQTRSNGRWLKVLMEPEKLQEPTLEQLKQIAVQSPVHGEKIKLAYLGTWETAGHSDRIEHKGGARILNVDFRFDGKKTNEQVIKEHLQKAIEPVASKYPSLKIRTVDANEADQKGRAWTLKIIALAAILIYLILSLTLRSFVQPFIVGLPIPFALMGVIWALKLHDLPLGLMSMIGLIGTMGVAVNDSIVMVDHINRLWRETGRRTKELIIEGAASRIRAICLTASCTLVGVFPAAYGIGGESGFTQPLAFAMGWGLSTSLFLTLFIIPAMVMVLEDIRKLIAKIKPKKPTETIVSTPTEVVNAATRAQRDDRTEKTRL